jgi:hypothetical protein
MCELLTLCLIDVPTKRLRGEQVIATALIWRRQVREEGGNRVAHPNDDALRRTDDGLRFVQNFFAKWRDYVGTALMFGVSGQESPPPRRIVPVHQGS